MAEEPPVDRAEGRLGRVGRGERHVAPAARTRDLAQRLVHEARLDGLALVGLHARSGGVRHRALHRVVAEADREHGHGPLLRELRRLKRAAAQVAAVGDQDDRVVLVLRGVERVERRADRAPEVRLAARRGIGRRALDRAAEEGVVRGERTQQHARAAEGDERAAVALKRLHEVRKVRLRALQPVRADVLREHRARHVERDHDVAGADLHLLGRLPPPGTRRRKEDQREPEKQQGGLQAEEPGIGRHQARVQRGGHERGEPFLRPGAQQHPHRARHRHERHERQHPGIDEFHTSLREANICSETARSRSAAPGTRNHGKYSFQRW